MTDDALLLRRYADERAEDAFAEFVRRQLPLVYSAALRRLGGDTHRAADVAQIVFCAVARDARRISEHAVLTGWLYTATRNAVIDVIRSEKRRRVREEEAHIMQLTLSDTTGPTDWSRLRPVLDSAMDELSERDREAVLLRFFQERPFAEVGRVLGLSEEAARKRVERALDKLRDVLARHKIASTSAALTALLSQGTVAAAPASLAASITGAALATGGVTAGGATLLTFFALTKVQVGIAAVVAAAGAAGFVRQQSTIASLRDSLAGAEKREAGTRAQADAELEKLRSEMASLKSTVPTGRSTSKATGAVVYHDAADRRPTTLSAADVQSFEVSTLAADNQGPSPAPENFPHAIAVRPQPARGGFPAGDEITITAVWGTRERIEAGGHYLVEGTYTLGSASAATLALSVTASSPENGSSRWAKTQVMSIDRGTGHFVLAAQMRVPGRFHVSFYPAGGGSSQGGVYFQER